MTQTDELEEVAAAERAPVRVVAGASASEKRIPWLRRLAALVPFVVFLPLFGWLAWQKAERSNSGIAKNDEHAMFDFDQHSYLNMGRMMREQNYDRVVPRHRMPGFSFLMSTLYSESDAYPIDPTGRDPRGVSEGYFNRAKALNIALGALSLVVLYGVCRRFLPIFESHLVTWCFGWLVAVIRVPYVQPEPVFYVLFLLAFVLLWRLLVRPRWWLAVLAGLVLATAFILKSTVVPLIALYLGCAAIRWGREALEWLRKNPLDRGAALPMVWQAVVALIVPVVFALILWPYLSNTARMHGSPLWDVHSKHYVWMDNDEDKRYWRAAGISNAGFVPPPDREVPTMRTYLRDHTLGEMGQRLKKGWYDIVTMIKTRYRGAYEVSRKWLLPLMLGLALVYRQRLARSFRDHWMEWLMVSGFFIGYGLLYCWYQAIGVGPRLFLALFLPFLFFAVLAIHRLAADASVPVRGRRIWLRPVLNIGLAVFIVVQTVSLLTGPYWTVEGGR